MHDDELATLCKKGKRSAQKELYDRFAPRMRGVCRRYITDIDEAEDVLQDGFFRVFTQIDKFIWQEENSLFFWIKKVMINVALNNLKKNKNRVFDEPFHDEFDLPENYDDEYFNDFHAKFSKEDVIDALTKIPEQFKIVLNMFVIDNMKHRDICEFLGIAEETSRSRLTRAKQMLRKILLSKVTVSTNVSIKHTNI